LAPIVRFIAQAGSVFSASTGLCFPKSTASS
jgi:hypothetical protein